MGLAWDGDFDRCFFFDEQGTFIEGYYLVGLLAEVFLKREQGARIVHDPRLTWNTLDIVQRFGGKAVLSKSGHAFIKQVMREVRRRLWRRDERAPLLPRFRLRRQRHDSVADRAAGDERDRQVAVAAGRRAHAAFPASGEINRKLDPSKGGAKAVLGEGRSSTTRRRRSAVDYTDGLSMEFDNWRFNLRASNTEPLVRLNVETRGDTALMQAKTKELLALMDA